MILGDRHWSSDAGDEEQREVIARFPSLRFSREHDGELWVRGSLEIAPSISYTINLLVPRKYPHDVPVLYCNRDEIPWEADRHVFESSGIACLCARSEFRKHWPAGSRLTLFFERLIVSFLVGQFYYQTHGQWPDSGQRAHGPKGILEAYREFASPIGDVSNSTMIRLMVVLARDREPKGHEWCPCGSGKILRKCHIEFVRTLRRQVQPEHARLDLEYLQLAAQRSNR